MALEQCTLLKIREEELVKEIEKLTEEINNKKGLLTPVKTKIPNFHDDEYKQAEEKLKTVDLEELKQSTDKSIFGTDSIKRVDELADSICMDGASSPLKITVILSVPKLSFVLSINLVHYADATRRYSDSATSTIRDFC